MKSGFDTRVPPTSHLLREERGGRRRKDRVVRPADGLPITSFCDGCPRSPEVVFAFRESDLNNDPGVLVHNSTPSAWRLWYKGSFI